MTGSRAPLARLAVVVMVLLAGCAAEPTPSPAPTGASAAAQPTASPPDSRPRVPLRGECDRLLTIAEVQDATGLHVSAAALAQRPFGLHVANLNGLQCEWMFDGSRAVAVTVFPASVLGGAEPGADRCWDGEWNGCQFGRIVGDYWFAGFIEAPHGAVDPREAIARIETLVDGRLDEPPPPRWDPEGAWRDDLECDLFAGLDLSGLGIAEFGTFIGETGGNAGPGPWFAYEHSGYRSCSLEGVDVMRGVSIAVQPGGGWWISQVGSGPSVEVAGAVEAVLIEPWAGARHLVVSDGVNLLTVGGGDVDDRSALADLAGQVLALPLD